MLVVHLQIHRLVRENLINMIALFIISIAVFIYMIYVLLKPENF
jgi:K+-transporting ATPase KdpF subunit